MTETPRHGATPEAELSALAACYRFILDCHAKKQAAGPAEKPDDRDDAKGFKHGVARAQSTK